jgi:uncharacterized membrane protein
VSDEPAPAPAEEGAAPTESAAPQPRATDPEPWAVAPEPDSAGPATPAPESAGPATSAPESAGPATPAPEELGWAALSSPIDAAWEPFAIPAEAGPAPAAKVQPPKAASNPVAPGQAPPPLTDALRGLGLLFASGTSLGLCAWELRAGPHLLAYVQSNSMPPRGRTIILADMLGTAAVFCLAALGYLFKRRRTFPAAARRLAEVGWRIAPLAFTAFVPIMLDWELWVGRELPFLMLAAIFGLGVQATGRAAFSAPPLGFFRRLGRWTRRPREAWARFAARHPRLVARLPTAAVALGAAGYALYFGAVTITSHHNLRTSSLDLGLEENLVWNALHWSRPFFKASPLGGPETSHFGFHATFISYLFALPYALAPRAETMLVIQALFVGGASLPLYFYARRHLGAWTAALISFAYLLYPPVHGANLYDFHYLPIGVFFLWLSLYALDARRPVLTVLAVLLSLATREDVGAGLAIIGAYLLLTGQRPRAGLVVAAIGAAYFCALKLIIQPRALAGDSAFLYMFRDLVPSGDNSFGGVLKTAIANPAYTLNTLIERDKLVYALQLFTPIAFLALRRPIGLLCCLPGVFFTLLSTGYAPLIQTSFQYTANWTTYLFMAIVGNLGWVSRPFTPGDEGGPARRKAWLLALAASTLVGSYQFGAIFQQHTIRGGFGVYTFGTTPTDLEHRKAIRALIDQIPPRAKVVASETIVPQLSNRPDAYTLRIWVADAEVLLFTLPAWDAEKTNALILLQNNSFGVVDVREPYVLAKKGAPTTRNAEIIARLR